MNWLDSWYVGSKKTAQNFDMPGGLLLLQFLHKSSRFYPAPGYRVLSKTGYYDLTFISLHVTIHKICPIVFSARGIQQYVSFFRNMDMKFDFYTSFYPDFIRPNEFLLYNYGQSGWKTLVWRQISSKISIGLVTFSVKLCTIHLLNIEKKIYSGASLIRTLWSPAKSSW
jgi:hypothetical protein